MDRDNTDFRLRYLTNFSYRVNISVSASVKISLLPAEYVVYNMPYVLVHLLRLVFEIPIPHRIDKLKVGADVLEFLYIVSLAGPYRGKKTIGEQFLLKITLPLD